MNITLCIGLTRQEQRVVDSRRVIDFLGDDGQAYSTPAMISDVEYACWRLLNEHLDPTQTSVGVHVMMEHVGATPLGFEVVIDVEVSGVERKRVDFETMVRDADGVVGRMRHSRIVVDSKEQIARIQAKRERLAQ